MSLRDTSLILMKSNSNVGRIIAQRAESKTTIRKTPPRPQLLQPSPNPRVLELAPKESRPQSKHLLVASTTDLDISSRRDEIPCAAL